MSEFKSIVQIAPHTDYTAKQLAWIRTNYGDFPKKKDKVLCDAKTAYIFLYDEQEVIEWAKAHKVQGRRKPTRQRNRYQKESTNAIDNALAQAFIRKPMMIIEDQQ